MQAISRLDQIRRRTLLTGGFAAMVLPGLARAAEPRSLSFEVLRNGKKIGEHTMTFEYGEVLTVRAEAHMAVNLGPISLFRYKHEATEHWRGGRFDSLDTKTENNGKMLSVSARREGGTVRIQPASGPEIQASGSSVPFTHWNRKILGAPLFNPQDGKLLRDRAAPAAQGSVTLADGSTRRAEGVVYNGELFIEDWYDEDAVWTGLNSRLKDGSRLDYRRL